MIYENDQQFIIFYRYIFNCPLFKISLKLTCYMTSLAKTWRGLSKISHQVQEYIPLTGIHEKTACMFIQTVCMFIQAKFAGKTANEPKDICQFALFITNSGEKINILL